jgi:hypothetical protein
LILVSQFSKKRNGLDLLTDVRAKGSECFKSFCWLRLEDFEILILLVCRQIAKEETDCRQSVSLQERLAQHTLDKASALTTGTNRAK